MKYLHIIYFIIIFLDIRPLHAQQEKTFQLIKTISGDISDFTTDNLGNIFLINSQQQIKKLNENYDSVGMFNDIRKFGKLYSIDATNPLKILLFYKDFSNIVILDRFLNIRNVIDLRQAGIFQCNNISLSFDNNIWLFDETDQKIKKINDEGKVLLETPDFRIIFDTPIQITSLIDLNKYLYVYDTLNGLLLFDYYGNLTNKVSFKGMKNLQGFSKGIIATDSSGLLYYHPSSIQTSHQNLPIKILSALKIRIEGSMMFCMPSLNRIDIYKIL